MSQQQQLANAMTTKYSASLELWEQQDTCITQGLCVEDSATGVENQSEDFFGVTTMRRKETRDTDLTKSEVPTRRRWVFSDPYYNQVPVDTSDKLRFRVDPATGIAQAQVAAAYRTKDKVFIAGTTGVAYAGKTFSTPVNLPPSGQLADANTGFTLAKYDTMTEYLKRYAMLARNERAWCLWTAFEETAFLNILQVTSGDYTAVRRRDDGSVASYGMIDFHRIEDLYNEDGDLVERMLPYGTGDGTGGTNTRLVIMGVKSALKRWTPGGIKGDVWWNGSKRQWEVTTELDVGAARRKDRGIVTAKCITTVP